MTHTVHVQVELTDEFIHDVMTNAVESGCLSYWATYRYILRAESLDVIEFQVADDEDIIEAINEHDNETAREAKIEDALFVVDADAITKGIQGCLSASDLSSEIKGYIYRAVTEMDAGDVDAIACDCIVQMAMFGEVVYG